MLEKIVAARGFEPLTKSTTKALQLLNTENYEEWQLSKRATEEDSCEVWGKQKCKRNYSLLATLRIEREKS